MIAVAAGPPTASTWGEWDRPFEMLQPACQWAGSRGNEKSGRRVRHLAAGFLWYSATSPAFRFREPDDLDARCVAAALDSDVPDWPQRWPLFARKWLKLADPHYLRVPVGISLAERADTLPLAIGHLYRSRGWSGLDGTLYWCARHHPALKGRIVPVNWSHPELAALVRDVYPEPHWTAGLPWIHAERVAPWLTDTVVVLARQMWDAREYSAAPILADALQDAGCDAADLLEHFRNPNQPHCRGCWGLELVLRGRPWEPTCRVRVPATDGRGNYLTRCNAVVGRPGTYDVCYRRAGSTMVSSLYADTSWLDKYYPNWQMYARTDPPPNDEVSRGTTEPARAATGDTEGADEETETQ